MPERKKILFISSWLSTRIVPNNANFVERHAAAVSIYHNVYLLHVTYDPKIKNGKKEYIELIEEGKNKLIIYFGVRRVLSMLNFIIKPVLYYSNYCKGYRYIAEKAGGFDLVHANIIFPVGVIALFFKRKFKVSYIISEHWSGYMRESKNKISFFKKIIIKKVIRNAFVICPVSDALSDGIKDLFPYAQITKVPNVVNTDIFKPDGAKNISGKVKIIHISGLLPVKNVEGILRAIKKISEYRNDFELHIVAEYDNDSIVELSQKLGIFNRIVFFHQNMSQQELAKTINGCDFLVMFSHTESFSLVVAEALACGKPVVASDVGGMKEHITKDTGVLVEPGNEEDLEKKLVYMIEHYKDYPVQPMQDYVLSNFSYDNVGRQFSELYSKVIGR